jgi:hypothetical protein
VANLKQGGLDELCTRRRGRERGTGAFHQ